MKRTRSVVTKLLRLYGAAVILSLVGLGIAVGEEWPLFVGIGLVVAAVGGVIAGVYMYRKIVLPVRHVAAASRRVAAGDHGLRVSVGDPAELAELARAVNLMAEQLGAGIETVEEGRTRLLLTLDALADGVVLIDGAGALSYANRAARDLLGKVPESVDTLTPLPLRSLIGESRSTGIRATVEFETGIPPRTITAACTPITDEGVMVLAVGDVTEQRRVMAARRDFVDDASHELKTPAATLRALAETVVRALDDNPDRARHFAEEMELEADRLGRIVSDLLDLSRLETQKPEMASLELHELVESVAKRVLSGTEHHLQLEPVRVIADADAFALAVRNVLDNAVRYGDGELEVNVKLMSNDGEAVVSISDNGPGIPTRDQPRIFERFYRVDGARSRETGGTGLGLAIVRHVMLQHGGRVEVDSVLGEGASFRLILPLPDTSPEV